ncbi:MAG: hypothetical protein WBR29_07270, partial [Gammaproteobacteria bacterium]
MSRATGALMGVAAILACGPVSAPVGPTLPANACPDSPCSAFAQQGATPTCTNGVCVVDASYGSSWTLVVSLAQDAFYAPGPTYAFGNEEGAPVCRSSASPEAVAGVLPYCACSDTACSVLGDLEVTPQAATLAKWNLGNAPADTVLPVQATFWPQWPEGGALDATLVGLPLPPITAPLYAEVGANLLTGPDGRTPPLAFCAGPQEEGACPTPVMPPGTYQRVLMPVAPFDAAYPPDIQSVTFGLGAKLPLESVAYDGHFDVVMGASGPSAFPTFDLVRADEQSLAGWTAYLRDQTTLRRISNLASLSGTQAKNVQLLTSHHPTKFGALENAELVMAPPPASGAPIWIFSFIQSQLPEAALPYPIIPRTVVDGQVTGPSGLGLSAQVVFEATALCRSTSIDGPALLDASPTDFSFEKTAATAADGKYPVELPRGQYQVTVVPTAPGAALLVKTLDTDVETSTSDPVCVPASPMQSQDFALPAQETVKGSACVADGRLLAGATVTFQPTACANNTSDPACLPRPAQTTVGDDGTFSIPLDQGGYWMRV